MSADLSRAVEAMRPQLLRFANAQLRNEAWASQVALLRGAAGRWAAYQDTDDPA